MEGFVFKNWAQTYTCKPELYFEPQTLPELGQVHSTDIGGRGSAVVLSLNSSPSESFRSSENFSSKASTDT